MATITLTSEEQTINLVTEGSVSLSASNGKSAYQSYLSTTTDDPVLTEAQWVASLDGPAGDKGDKGDPGDTGPMPYNYRGAWDGYTNYSLYDAVTHQGSLYWLPATGGWTVGGAPPAYNWELLVSKGDAGDSGDQGETGKSAYQSYLDTTTDDPVLTEAEWSEGGGGGGGDYLPLAGGIMDNGAEIAFDNASKIRQTPGSNGIDQVCSIDYVHRWKEGSLYIMDQSGGIRSVQYGLSFTPDSNFDITQGYLVGSRFIKDDGTVFECTNNTDGAAVWENITPIPISTPGIAHVNSGGDDSTGAISDPSKPYLTAQAAWDDGARNIEFGVGSYTITHFSSESDASLDIFFRGAGKEATTLDFTFTGLNGTHGVDQTDPGQTGNPGTGGGNAGAFALSSDKSLSINLVAKGGTGGNGGKGGPGSADPEIVGGNGGYGGNAGNGPTYEVFNCVLATLYNETDPGQGGPPGDDGGFGTGIQGASGTSGAGVTQHYYWCDINSFGNNVSPGYMDVCFRDDKLFANVPSNRVEYGAGFVEEALDVLYGERVETRRIESNNWFTTSSTVADVNNLSCVIAPSEQLTIEIFGFHTSGTGGMKVSFSGPSSPTFLRYNFHHWTTVTAVRSPIPGAATAFNTDLTEGAGSAVVMPFHVLLTVKNGANQGTIQFRAASVTGGQTLTLLQETVMRVTR